MSRILLLSIFILWMAWRQDAEPSDAVRWHTAGIFLGALASVVLVLGIWARALARRVAAQDIHRSLRRYNRVVSLAQGAIPAWFAAGLFALGWGDAALRLMGPAGNWSIQTPAALIGTMPALVAWCALWWSQYPAERALREQSMVARLERGMPVYAPPRMRDYLLSNLRLQLLFIVVPVALLLGAHDVMDVAVLRPLALTPQQNPIVEMALMLLSTGAVFVVAPAVLRRVLHTEPLADGPLRQRLEALCRQYKMRYREILLWRTHHNMGNAAVMGIVPRFRYILMSDLLLESMTPEQVEAVFAHELGHVVHRHMLWYLLVVVGFMFLLVGPGQWVDEQAQRVGWLAKSVPSELLSLVLGGTSFIAAFGYISRRFERQADVFAARTMESNASPSPVMSSVGVMPINPVGQLATSIEEDATHPLDGMASTGHVGPYGAALFASALHRVAVMNGIPVGARSWCHGSIAKRMRYLLDLGDDPARTREFDRIMRRLRLALVGVVMVSGAWAYAADMRLSAPTGSGNVVRPLPAASGASAVR